MTHSITAWQRASSAVEERRRHCQQWRSCRHEVCAPRLWLTVLRNWRRHRTLLSWTCWCKPWYAPHSTSFDFFFGRGMLRPLFARATSIVQSTVAHWMWSKKAKKFGWTTMMHRQNARNDSSSTLFASACRGHTDAGGRRCAYPTVHWRCTYGTSSWSLGVRDESPLIMLRTSINAWAISLLGTNSKPRRHRHSQ